jgi:hypothetical protein
MNPIKQFNIPYKELNLTPEKILRNFNSENSSLDKFSYDFLDEFLFTSSEFANIRGGFAYIEPGHFTPDKDKFYIDSTVFHSQKIIASKLRKSDSAVLFVVTAGNYFEEYARRLMNEGDVFCAYLIDASASEVVESGAEWMEKKIDSFVMELGFKTTSRYSPGYCGWSVGEQHKLFSFLPENFCGIQLTESALMLPVKSISGIIGVGASVKKEEYECAICDDENCFRRK